MSSGELDTRKPTLLPASLTASAEVKEEQAKVLQRTTGLELPAIVDKLASSNRVACKSGSCALRATCELVPEQLIPEDNHDPMNYWPEHTVPAYHRVEITCAPSACAEFKRTGRAIGQLAGLVKVAVKTEADAETAHADQIALGSANAREALEPGKQQAEGILANARSEADRILSAAQESATELMQPFESSAAVIRAETLESAESARRNVIDQFRMSVSWLT